MKKIFVSLLLLNALASAQDYSDSLKAIEDHYKSFRYAEVIQKTTNILQMLNLPTDTLINLYMMKGISHFALQEDTLAKNSFLEIIKIDSSFLPDSVVVSPKIVRFFQNVKSTYLRNLPYEIETNEINPDSVYLPLYQKAVFDYSDNFKNTVIRSLVFPGWGHLYSRDRKGWYLTFAGGVSFVSSVYFIIKTENKRSDYLNEKDPETISLKYDSYNFYYKNRNISLAIFGTIWLFAQIDLFTSVLTNYPEIDFNITPAGLANLSLKLRF